MCCWIYFLSWWPVGRHSTRLNSLFHSYYYYYSAPATATAAPYTSSAAELRDFTDRRTLPHPFWGFTWIRQKGDTFFPLSLGSAEGFKWRGPIECIKNWRPHPRERRRDNDDNEEKSALSPSVCYWILLLLLLCCPGDTLTMMTTNVRPSVRPLFVCLRLYFTISHMSTTNDERRRRQ